MGNEICLIKTFFQIFINLLQVLLWVWELELWPK